ncbi:MAG: hypothetical protein NT120_03375 [Candidatus Aenigmarchaeota archaeon]|nr:hypothetical protein [Candidatus Aenigmarchaeota archaeon]
MAPERCGKCPVFHESKNTPPVMKGKLMTPENEEFYRKMMGK